MIDFSALLGERKQLDPNTGAVINAGNAGGGFWSQVGDKFSDPNFIQALGQGAGAVTGEGTWQADMGNIASNWARNEAFQEAAAKQLRERDTFQSRLLQAISEGGVLGPKDDNDTLDSITFDGDGGVNMSLKNTPQASPAFESEQRKIESRNLGRGVDLPDFSWSSLA